MPVLDIQMLTAVDSLGQIIALIVLWGEVILWLLDLETLRLDAEGGQTPRFDYISVTPKGVTTTGNYIRAT
jgi:hypothetical protein